MLFWTIFRSKQAVSIFPPYITTNGGAITMMVAGIILYCLIKRRLVRCCEKENPAHLLEQGGDRGIAKMAKMPRWPPAHGPCSPAASAHSGLQPVRHREHVGSHASAVRCHGQPTVQPARATGAAEDLGGHRSSPPQPVPVV